MIAAITSCTNTSNPEARITAGLLALNARRRGPRIASSVNVSPALGSRVVTNYFEKAKLLSELTTLGLDIVGYGCTTCVGNLGEIASDVAKAIDEQSRCVGSILSSNRNFKGRNHSKVKANFLTFPAFVIAYALADSMRRDLRHEPVAKGADGQPIYLVDIWPCTEETATVVAWAVSRDLFKKRYGNIESGSAQWIWLAAGSGPLCPWHDASTYIRRSPFFSRQPLFENEAPLLRDPRPLLILGNSIATDHISPVGAIDDDSPAGEFRSHMGIPTSEFNAYGARRGNDDVMARDTFANGLLQNAIATRPGPVTMLMPEAQETIVFQASLTYVDRDQGIVIIGGRHYGTGSTRDWAAKGTRLLDVKAVLAISFERICRANLVRMGVLSLQFADPDVLDGFSVAGSELISINVSVDAMAPRARIPATLERINHARQPFELIVRADTADELHISVKVASCLTSPINSPTTGTLNEGLERSCGTMVGNVDHRHVARDHPLSRLCH